MRKTIKLGTKQGELIVVESGLESGDTVIVDGIQRVRSGIEVAPEIGQVSMELEIDDESSSDATDPENRETESSNEDSSSTGQGHLEHSDSTQDESGVADSDSG